MITGDTEAAELVTQAVFVHVWRWPWRLDGDIALSQQLTLLAIRCSVAMRHSLGRDTPVARRGVESQTSTPSAGGGGDGPGGALPQRP